MEKSNKKSFLKGLFIGIGGTLLTALLGITVYGCASINAKGSKAFGDNEVNIVGATGTKSSDYVSSDLTSVYLDMETNGNVGYDYYLGSWENGDYLDVLDFSTEDRQAFFAVHWNVLSNGGNLYGYLSITCDSRSRFNSGTIYWALYEGSNTASSFNGDSNGSWSVNWNGQLNNNSWRLGLGFAGTPVSGVSFVYDQPLFDSSSSETSSGSVEESSVSVENFGKYYSFAKGVFPAEIAPNIEYGNIGIFESERANSSFDVYLGVTTQVNNQNYDRIALHFKSLNRSYDNYTEYVTLSGATVGTIGGGLGGGIDNNRFYCDSVTLDYYVGQGSTVSWYETVLAKCPEVFYNNSKRTVDTRLSWVFYQNEFYFSPYTLNDAVQGVSWGASLTNEQALNLIGASAYASNIGQGTWTDVFDLFGDAFGVVEVIFNMQVFPFATLGVFLLIPIVVGIVLFVVGLFKR